MFVFFRFCVALVRPGSITRLPGMFDLVDKSSSRLTSGEILPFVRFEAGRWTVCVDFASTANLESIKSGRVEQGYREIQPAKSTLPQQLQGRMDRLEWMAANFFTNKKDVEMSNGDLLTVQVSGDVEMCEDGSTSVGIRFHAKLKENCRTLDIRPKGKIGDVGQLENGNKSLLGVVKVSYVPHRGTTSVWYRLFVFEIKPVTVKSYWGLDTTEDASEATAAPSPGVPRKSLWSLVKFDMAKEKQGRWTFLKRFIGSVEHTEKSEFLKKIILFNCSELRNQNVWTAKLTMAYSSILYKGIRGLYVRVHKGVIQWLTSPVMLTRTWGARPMPRPRTWVSRPRPKNLRIGP